MILITVHNEVAKVMFLHLSVCPQGGICLSAFWDGMPPPTDQELPPPPEQGTTGTRNPSGPGTHPDPTPSGADDCCCGRYASYWNAFLLMCLNFHPKRREFKCCTLPQTLKNKIGVGQRKTKMKC